MLMIAVWIVWFSLLVLAVAFVVSVVLVVADVFDDFLDFEVTQFDFGFHVIVIEGVFSCRRRRHQHHRVVVSLLPDGSFDSPIDINSRSMSPDQHHRRRSVETGKLTQRRNHHLPRCLHCLKQYRYIHEHHHHPHHHHHHNPQIHPRMGFLNLRVLNHVPLLIQRNRHVDIGVLVVLSTVVESEDPHLILRNQNRLHPNDEHDDGPGNSRLCLPNVVVSYSCGYFG